MRHAVLVVDDYQDSREFMSSVLHNAGFIVRTACNGLEAVIAAHEMQPAVIVMDVLMPVLDGVEATRLIKAIDEVRAARVIAYTARAPLDPRLTDELFSVILPKPSSPDIVVAAVQRCARA
jgi:CheY-like chemotaxis protein